MKTAHGKSKIILWLYLTVICSRSTTSGHFDPTKPSSAFLVDFNAESARNTCLKAATIDKCIQTGFKSPPSWTGVILIAVTLIAQDTVALIQLNNRVRNRQRKNDQFQYVLVEFSCKMEQSETWFRRVLSVTPKGPLLYPCLDRSNNRAPINEWIMRTKSHRINSVIKTTHEIFLTYQIA